MIHTSAQMLGVDYRGAVDYRGERMGWQLMRSHCGQSAPTSNRCPLASNNAVHGHQLSIIRRHATVEPQYPVTSSRFNE